MLTSFGMWVLGRPLVASVEEKAAAEGNFRYELTRARHHFEASAFTEKAQRRCATDDGLAHPVETNFTLVATPQAAFDRFLQHLTDSWGFVIQGQTKVVFLTHANNLLAPIVPLVLGAPKYLAGDLSLGDLMQAAAAFLQVQLSLNWLADNALSIANWSASARRVAALALAMDAQEMDSEIGSEINLQNDFKNERRREQEPPATGAGFEGAIPSGPAAGSDRQGQPIGG
jgi:putative ATP-binding cassette transporter